MHQFSLLNYLWITGVTFPCLLSLRWTAGVGSDSVRLRESPLYILAHGVGGGDGGKVVGGYVILGMLSCIEKPCEGAWLKPYVGFTTPFAAFTSELSKGTSLFRPTSLAFTWSISCSTLTVCEMSNNELHFVLLTLLSYITMPSSLRF